MAKHILIFSFISLVFQSAFCEENFSYRTNRQYTAVVNTDSINALQEIEAMLFSRMEAEKAKMENEKIQVLSLRNSQSTGKNGGFAQQSMQSGGLPTQAEYDALMDFYAATDGTNWINKTGWSTANPSVLQGVSGFAGVATNANGNVIAIYLPNNNIVGEMPESFGDLVYLEQLYLFSNNLYQKIPQSIGNLVNLKGLYLNSSRLDWHEIPETIGNLANLEYLHLHSNYLQGTIPASFGNLSKLRELYLLNTKLTGEIPEEIGNLSLLAYMRLENSLLEGPIPGSFSNLTQMVDIRLHNNQLTGPVPSYLCSFPNLTTVTLYDNYLTGNLPGCLYTKNLAYLQVANNSFTVESVVEMAANISNPSDYLPQRQSLETVYEYVADGDFLVLTTDLGTNTQGVSTYRWVKDGVPLVSGFQQNAFEFTDTSFSCEYYPEGSSGPNSCNGTYYVEIQNSLLPAGTIMKGPPIEVETVSENLTMTICP